MGRTFQAEGGLEQKHPTVGGAGSPFLPKERAESVEFSAVAPLIGPWLLWQLWEPMRFSRAPEEEESRGSVSRSTCRVASKGSRGTTAQPERVLAFSDAGDQCSQTRDPERSLCCFSWELSLVDFEIHWAIIAAQGDVFGGRGGLWGSLGCRWRQMAEKLAFLLPSGFLWLCRSVCGALSAELLRG